jgi:UDP-N-acetylglucosamine 1-carboxyvinyltransferase
MLTYITDTLRVMANKNETQKIGNFISKLRNSKGYTTEQLAEKLSITVGELENIESGKQSCSTDFLDTLSEVLNHKIIEIADSSMDFQVEGGYKLSGSIETNTSKNGAMGLLAASILNHGTTTLHGIPRIEEVYRILEVMESIGIDAQWLSTHTLQVRVPKDLKLDEIDAPAASRTRTIIMFIGGLIHRFKDFKIPHSAGCSLGKRSISTHIFGLEKLGVKIKVNKDNYRVTADHLKPAEIVMYEAGDTPTENLLIAAAKIPGKTIIKFASANYMVQDVCFFLEKLGVRVEGIGSQTLTVYGISEINCDVEYYNSEDPIETMMFLSAAITTNSSIVIQRAPIDFLQLELLKLEKMGFKYKLSKKYKAKNGHTDLVDITTLESKLKAPDDKITSGAYPDINMDNLPFFVPIATQAKGTTLIHDWTFEDRAIYFVELRRLGATINFADPHRVFVEGVTDLKAGQVVCPPALRPAMIILIAMLAAPGTSILRNVYSIRRGYEDIANRLNSLGAKITVLE